MRSGADASAARYSWRSSSRRSRCCASPATPCAVAVGEQWVLAAARRECALDRAEHVEDVEVTGVGLAERSDEHAGAEAAGARGRGVEGADDGAPEPGEVDGRFEHVEGAEAVERRPAPGAPASNSVSGHARTAALAAEVAVDDGAGPRRRTRTTRASRAVARRRRAA